MIICAMPTWVSICHNIPRTLLIITIGDLVPSQVWERFKFNPTQHLGLSVLNPSILICNWSRMVYYHNFEHNPQLVLNFRIWTEFQNFDWNFTSRLISTVWINRDPWMSLAFVSCRTHWPYQSHSPPSFLMCSMWSMTKGVKSVILICNQRFIQN